MADHVRNQVRDAAVTALTGLTTTTTHVSANRDRSLQSADLPGLRIYTGSESVSLLSLGGSRTRERVLELVVEACAKSNSTVADTIDDICKEVETALDNDNTLGGKCKWIEPAGFEFELDGEADKTIAVGRMTFTVHYYTRKGAPDVSV